MPERKTGQVEFLRQNRATRADSRRTFHGFPVTPRQNWQGEEMAQEPHWSCEKRTETREAELKSTLTLNFVLARVETRQNS